MGCSSSSLLSLTTNECVPCGAEAEAVHAFDIHIELLDANNYEIGELIAEGSMAKIYAARHKNGEEVALKFFGYTSHYPDFDSVKHELELMSYAQNISGIVRTSGYFMDTRAGLVPMKIHHTCSYPVIVMEKLEGGELFECVKRRGEKFFTEQYVADLFKAIVIGVAGLHAKRLLHRKYYVELLCVDYLLCVFVLLPLLLLSATAGHYSVVSSH
jgi:serine/threonine protein kinase